MTNTEQAVALAIKHGLLLEDEYKTGGKVLGNFTDEALTAMLADHRQQVIGELANKAGVMPEPAVYTHHDGAFRIALHEASLNGADTVPVKRVLIHALSVALGNPEKLSALAGDTVEDSLVELAATKLVSQQELQWVGLTLDEVLGTARTSQDGISPRDDTERFARAIEAKLREKNAGQPVVKEN